MFCIYLLINESKGKTYVGFSDNIAGRIAAHQYRKVKSTKNFGEFRYFILEDDILNERQARNREKYWNLVRDGKK